MDERPAKKPRKKPRDESNETAMDERPTKKPRDESNETAMDDRPTKKPRDESNETAMDDRPTKKPRDETNETTMDEIPTKRPKVDYSNVGIEDVTSYRRDVVGVFISNYDRIRTVLEENMVSFVSKVYSKQLISSQNKEFLSIFKQFKTGFESCRSISKIQQQYKCFIGILLDIGGPVGVVGKEIEEKLSNLTGK